MTIEYSANVAEDHDIQGLVNAAHEAALGTGMAALAGMRTRAARRDHYRIANADPNHAMIAIHARVGPGRERAQRREFIETVLDATQKALGESSLNIAWSIEITELDAELRINDNRVKETLNAKDT